MAKRKVSALTDAGTLNGAEAVYVVKSGASRQTTAQKIANTASVLGAFTSGAHLPTTDDGAALGSTAFKWSDLFLSSGGVINWNSGNLTATHSAGLLTFNGGLAMTTLAASGNSTVGGTLGVTGMTTLTGGLTGGVQTLTGAGAVNLTTPITHLVTTGANALTLADGNVGQVKAIVMLTDGGDGTLTPTNFGNGTTITFNDVGDSVLLVFLGTDWWIISNNGCTVA